jgi:hypothetical protein
MAYTKLSIELVPQTCWYSNLRSALSQSDWDKLRKQVYKDAGHKCEICDSDGMLHAHEMWSYDDEKHIQKLIRPQALCPACHEVKHIGFANIKGRGQQAIAHLAKINDWTLEQASKYVDEQFKVWSKRSKFRWICDTSSLESYGLKSLVNPT